MFKFLTNEQRDTLKELADIEIEAKKKAAKKEYDNVRFEYMIKPFKKFRENLDYSKLYSTVHYDSSAIYVSQEDYETVMSAMRIFNCHKSELLR